MFFNLKPSVCATFEGVFEDVDLNQKLYYDYQQLEKAIEELNFVGSNNSLTPTINTIATAESA